MIEGAPAPCVVVGIDGSPAAVDAALWAIDVAIEQDVPLRLVYVIDTSDSDTVDPQDQARQLATAEVAVRYVLTAVESTERPVKIEVEILQGRPVETLLEASRTAVMLCVGARGLRHAIHGRIGSTAGALSKSAHCPVAIVRAHRPHANRDRAVVIEVDDNAAGNVILHRGLEEAQRRRAPVRVLAPAHTYADVQAHWERRLDESRRRFPQLDIASVTWHGDALEYLAANAGAIQLVITGRTRSGGLGALVGAQGNAALRDTDCSILVCGPHAAL